MKDIIIIGAGPAGLTAALYATRAGKSVLVFEKNIYGGQVATSSKIENYPAIAEISGADFAINIYNQVINLGAEIVLEEVKSVDLSKDIKKVFTDTAQYEAKAVIIANGVKRRNLGCKGEAEFFGRGVSYCATCDGAFFKGKDVVVVGAGSAALEESLFLSNICKNVFIINRRDKVRGEPTLFNAINKKDNIKMYFNTVVDEICGDDKKVSHVILKDKITNKNTTLITSAVFISIGSKANNEIFTEFVDLDKDGYIACNESCTTNLPGVFVAGDTRTKTVRQIVTAEADGAIAAIEASQYLNRNN